MNAMLSPFPRREPVPEAAQPYWNALADAVVGGTSRYAVEALLAELSRADSEFDPKAGPSMLRRALLDRLNRS